MANEFDPYREALIVETGTIWPEISEDRDADTRRRIEESLHAAPQDAAELTYERQHTGFSRIITVTPEDLKRIGAG